VAGADRMTIEEVVRKVLLDEHADVLREAVRAVAAELMEVALLLRDPGTPARSQRITALRPLELACRSPAARSSRRRPPVRTFSVPAARSTSRAHVGARSGPFVRGGDGSGHLPAGENLDQRQDQRALPEIRLKVGRVAPGVSISPQWPSGRDSDSSKRRTCARERESRSDPEASARGGGWALDFRHDEA
jgi:hypothetical protein